jgi:phage tail-like protein
MEDMHAPVEGVLANVDVVFDPYRAPERFLPFLARWVALDGLLDPSAGDGSAPVWPSGAGRLRELIANAVELARWRGTAAGLVRFLEIATGVSGFEVVEQPAGPDGRPRPFHLLVHAPSAARTVELLVRRIVEQEKPVYVTHEVVFAEA